MEKFIKPVNSETHQRKHWGGYLVGIIFGLIILGCLYQISKLSKEILFTIQHPILVNELMTVYKIEHSKADEQILIRQRADFTTAPETGTSAEPKK